MSTKIEAETREKNIGLDASKKTTSEKSQTEEIKTFKKLSQLEFERKVKELAKKGMTSEKIGEELRQQGLHPKEYKRKISKILEKDYISPDLKNIETKLKKIKEHCEKHKQDKKALREKERIFSQLRKVQKYLGIAVK